MTATTPGTPHPRASATTAVRDLTVATVPSPSELAVCPW